MNFFATNPTMIEVKSPKSEIKRISREKKIKNVPKHDINTTICLKVPTVQGNVPTSGQGILTIQFIYVLHMI